MTNKTNKTNPEQAGSNVGSPENAGNPFPQGNPWSFMGGRQL